MNDFNYSSLLRSNQLLSIFNSLFFCHFAYEQQSEDFLLRGDSISLNGAIDRCFSNSVFVLFLTNSVVFLRNKGSESLVSKASFSYSSKGKSYLRKKFSELLFSQLEKSIVWNRQWT